MLRALALVLAASALPAAAQPVPPPFAAFDLAGPEVLNDPHDLAFGPDGRLYVADKFADRIAVLDPETLELVAEIVPGALPGVHDIAFDAAGRVAVSVTGANAALVFEHLHKGEVPEPWIYPAPRTEGAALHSNGRLYVTAGGSGQVIAYEGMVVKAIADGHPGAHDIAEAPDGSLWIADTMLRRLVRYSPELERLQVIDHPKFGFAGPRYLDFDGFGRLVVADQDAHRILLIDPEGPDGGTLLGVLGDGVPGKGPMKFDDPEGVAVRGSRFFFADSDNNRIVRYSIVMN